MNDEILAQGAVEAETNEKLAETPQTKSENGENVDEVQQENVSPIFTDSEAKQEELEQAAVEAATEEQLTDATPETSPEVDEPKIPAQEKDASKLEDQNTDATIIEEQDEELAHDGQEDQEADQGEVKEETTMEDFEIVSLHPGQIVTGKILRVTDNELIVNVGYKSDGVVSIDDIMLEEEKPLTEVFHEGDNIEVEVRKVNDGDGNVILSQKNIVKNKAWTMIEEAFHNEQEIIGTGMQVVKGGLLASIKGFTAFVPASQLSLRYVADLNIFVGQELRLRILETDKRRNRVVASQRAVLETDEAEKRKQVWETIEEGQLIKGEVKRITNFGAFVDIGGVDGLIHISDLSWGHIKSPKQVVSEGQEIEVIILSVDKEKNRISLGYKQTLPHPWDNIEEKYPTGKIFEGKIVRITSFGAFIELEPGVDGLVHISQISDQRVNKVEDVLKTGEMTHVKVLDVKPKEKRISLSIKEAVEKPVKQEKEEKKRSPKESPFVKEEMTFTLGDILQEQKNKEES